MGEPTSLAGSRRDPPTHSRRGRVVVTACCVVLACCVVVVVSAGAGLPVVGLTSAGDNAAIFNIEPEEIEADPGETVAFEVVVYSHGSLRGHGLGEIAFNMSYDPEVVSAAEVEHGEWLAGEDATLASFSNVDATAGLISVDQAREPVGDGVTGHGVVATISLTIAEDAEPTNLELAFEDASALLSSGDPQYVWDQGATIYVDGGVEDDGTERDDIDGVTLGDDADLSGTDDAEGGEGETDALAPGFGIPATVLAVFGISSVLWLALRRHR